MNRLVRSLLVLAFATCAPWSVAPVAAAPCAGFIDVDDSNPAHAPFCGNVAWLRNRAVTLGCALAQSYCPNDDVTRLSMSAFLNRLGNALTPRYFTANNSGSSLNVDTPNQLCPVSSLQAPSEADFVRRAHGVGVITAGCSTSCISFDPDASGPHDSAADAGDLDYAVGIVESQDSGLTWSSVSPLIAVSVGPNVIKTATVFLPPRDLLPAAPRQWAIRVSRVAGSTAAIDLTSWACQLQVQVENRVTTSAPFDDADE